MGILDGVKGYFNKKSEQREHEEALKKEAEDYEKIEYEKNYRQMAREAARLRALKRAQETTGLAKLRAISEANAPSRPSTPKMQKFKEFRQRNLMRRDENLARSAALKQAATNSRQERIQRIQANKLRAATTRPTFKRKDEFRPSYY